MIQLENIFKEFEGGLVKALNGVSLQIPRGEVCAIMGPSGCGKSTLLNLIGALDLPSSGTIIIDKKPLQSHRPLCHYRNRRIGFIFQLHNLIPNLTLVENVEIPLHATKEISTAERRKRALAFLAEMGLSQRAFFLPTQVSGGERQRTAVARAMINNPDLLLADEPTGSVDSQTADFIIDSMLRRCRQQQMTALIVTHDREIAERADRLLKMRDGRIED